MFVATPVEVGWSDQHRIVAAIAEKHLNNDRRLTVRILAHKGALTELADLADQIKSKPWHCITLGQQLQHISSDPRGNVWCALYDREW